MKDIYLKIKAFIIGVVTFLSTYIPGVEKFILEKVGLDKAGFETIQNTTKWGILYLAIIWVVIPLLKWIFKLMDAKWNIKENISDKYWNVIKRLFHIDNPEDVKSKKAKEAQAKAVADKLDSKFNEIKQSTDEIKQSITDIHKHNMNSEIDDICNNIDLIIAIDDSKKKNKALRKLKKKLNGLKSH